MGWIWTAIGIYLLVLVLMFTFQRSMLYLASHAEPDLAAAEHHRGSSTGGLLSGFTIDDLYLRRADGLEVELGRLEVRAAWLALLDDEFALARLHLADARIRLPSSSPPAEDTPPGALEAPYPLRVDDLRVRGLSIEGLELPDGVPDSIETLDAALAWRGTRVDIGHFSKPGPAGISDCTCTAAPSIPCPGPIGRWICA